ncbi:MAG TPA: Asp-tRNA(Asn)/Glu-tRNA(Gln) amidotransferase subunit GatC [Candidatus Saccharimonadales bacterium]|jgi:aspartyl-tRNA(Asn)/glutamyl-tRNA(Gln) amidotransferase subunit C
MADLTRDDILKLAQLARISLDDDEVAAFSSEFNEILQYVEQLNAVDTAGLQPTSQVTGLVNVTRADEIGDYGYEPKSLLQNVPTVQGDLIKVRRMIG